VSSLQLESVRSHVAFGPRCRGDSIGDVCATGSVAAESLGCGRARGSRRKRGLAKMSSPSLVLPRVKRQEEGIAQKTGTPCLITVLVLVGPACNKRHSVPTQSGGYIDGCVCQTWAERAGAAACVFFLPRVARGARAGTL
jgi:hypothetical protein